VLLDITTLVSPRTAAFPGDPPFAWHLARELGEGSDVNLGQVSTGTHIGTHVDAPWHFLPGGARVHELPLDAFAGPARVVHVLGARRVEASEAVLRQLDGAPRVLFRTAERKDATRFDPGFAGLDPGLAEELGRRGVLLCGTDAPSVDSYGAPGLPAHHALARGGCHIVEGLDLTRAAPGDYEFLGLPLRLEGLDASPIRAVLRR
jgi:arylformamidase